MSRERNRSPLRSGRGVALAIAISLLVAQSLATAHYHVKDFRAGFERTQIAESFCPLCLFHFHAPRNPAAPPMVAGPAVVQQRPAVDRDGRLFIVFLPLRFSRAPPASV